MKIKFFLFTIPLLIVLSSSALANSTITAFKKMGEAIEHAESASSLFIPSYIYQRQPMKEVSWLYTGLVPRQENPDLIDVTISKGGFTLKVILQLTKANVADYPSYLVRRADYVKSVISEENLKIYDWSRLSAFFQATDELKTKGVTPINYHPQQFKLGLDLLKEHFPKNIFTYDNIDLKYSDEVVLEAVFVYPITINRGGKTWPPDGRYIQANSFSSIGSAVQERRTDHGARVWVDTDGDGKEDTKKRVITDYIFSGFPAFWIDHVGKGTGIHGPIRYSEMDQRGKNQGGPYGKAPEQMQKFWQENEFADFSKAKTNFDGVRYRWDVVRTNNSAGCFRAETMELRHLLPAAPETIFENIEWKVISDIDRYRPPNSNQNYYVDVNYYMVNPYARPLKQREWVKQNILNSVQKKSADADNLVDDYIESALVFPYLDPSTVEFELPESFNERLSTNTMSKLNRAGNL